MSALAALQQRFQEAVLAGNATPGLFVGEEVQLPGGLPIYLRAYRARLTGALRDNFPVLHRALGDDAFAALACAYIDAHPSNFRSIRWFGSSLPEFLLAASESLPHPALFDLARMDWAMRAAFDAAAAELLASSDLVSLQPEDWPAHRFKLLPSVRLLDLAWNVEPIWKALNDDPEAATEEPETLPHVLLVWRPALDCRWRSAESCEGAALRALAQGASFAECCTILAASGEPEPAQIAARFLGRWIADGLLARG